MPLLLRLCCGVCRPLPAAAAGGEVEGPSSLGVTGDWALGDDECPLWRTTKILPILMPLQQVRRAASMLSPVVAQQQAGTRPHGGPHTPLVNR